VTYVPNTKAVVLDDAFYNPSTARIMGNAANFNIQDGSWFRLRTVSLNYAIPKAADWPNRFLQEASGSVLRVPTCS
jgi:hypothetical protein